MIQIENRAEESDDGEDDDHAAYYLIDYDDAVGIKLVPNLVDEPGESEPPQQGSEDDAEIPYSHFYRHIRYDESKLREGGHEEEHDERIGECHQERREAVVHQCALLRFVAPMNILRRVGAIAVDAKQQQYNTATYLKHKTRTLVAHKIHDKTHTDTRKQRIYKVADTSTDTRNKTIPATFIQSSLYAKHPHRTHRSRCHDANQYSMEYKV